MAPLQEIIEKLNNKKYDKLKDAYEKTLAKDLKIKYINKSM